MNPSQYEDAVRIFRDAREQRDPKQFVAELGLSDPDIRDCVFMMLDHDSRSFDSELDRHQLPEPPFEGLEFRLLERVGEGGMGVVYKALRRKLERTVALKFPRQTALSPFKEQRLPREAQILAKLGNPNIATVYGIGTFPLPSGAQLPFIEMEYVDGVPISEYVLREQLPERQRLELFVLVCRAIDDAHSHRVLHRDLSSNNILVTSKGTPKIIDFGIASLFVDDSGVAERQLYGTPPYMSPEALRGELVSVRSDVYSLGVLLQQLLCQRSSEDKFWFSRNLSGDLGQIVVRARAQEPAMRYKNAASLADDIQRYLDHFPVTARRRTPEYVARRFVRRHPWFVGGAALLITIVALAWVNESRLRRVAQQAQAGAENEAAISKEVIDFLNNDLLASTDPAVAQGEDITVRQVLDRASAAIGSRFDDKPLVEAAIRSTMGRAYLALGEYETAEGHTARALELRESTLGRHEHLTIESRSEYGVVLNEMGRYEEAVATLTDALDVQEGARRYEEPLTLAILETLGYSYRMMSRFEEAEQAYQQVLAIRERVRQPDDLHLLETLSKLAALRFQQGRYEEARVLAKRVLDGRRVSLGERHPDTLHALNNLAGIYWRLGDPERAESGYRELSGRYREVLGVSHPDTIMSMNNLAVILRSQKKLEEAETVLRECVAVYKDSLGDADPRTIGSIANLAATIQDQERFDEAEVLFSEAIKLGRAVLGEQHWYIGAFELARSQCIAGLGRHQEAELLMQHAHAVLLEALGPDHERTTAAALSLENLRKEIESRRN